MSHRSIKILPFISVIIACRNEERRISLCLDSIINQDYLRDKMEIFVIDGLSQDKTVLIIKKYARRYRFIKLITNRKKITPAGFNLGIKNSRGKFLAFVSGHSTLKPDYLKKCLYYLKKYQADNVGGLMKIKVRQKTLLSQAIALAWVHPLATGKAYYKIGASGPRWVDTVFGGCYPRELFNKIGLFDERFIRTQDLEFNLRLKKAGGKTLFVPEIISYYYPRARFWECFHHVFQDGIWVTYPLKFKFILRPRHYAPLLALMVLAAAIALIFFWPIVGYFVLLLLGFYAILLLWASMSIAWREKNGLYFLLLPLIFSSRHLAYGLGSLWGLIKIVIPSTFNYPKNLL